MNYRSLLIMILTGAFLSAPVEAGTVSATTREAQGFQVVHIKSHRTKILDDDDGVTMNTTIETVKIGTTPHAAPSAVARPAAPAPTRPPELAPLAPPISPTPAPKPPVVVAPAPTPAPDKPKYPTCSSKVSDVKAMMQDHLGLNMIGRTWTEDVPKFGGKSQIKVIATNEDKLLVEMFNGSGESVGVTKITACVEGSKIVAHITMAGLNFGFFANGKLKTQLLASQQGDASQLIFDISKGAGGRVRIADRMTGFPEQRIDSTFSAVAR